MQRLTLDRRATGRRRAAWLVGFAVLGMAAVGCGGGSSTTTGSAGTSAASGAAVLTTADTPLGTILVDSAGRAVYLFEADSPGTSACTGACLTSWPIVTAPSSLPTSVAGITAKLGVLERPDGTRQLTVDGLPVYTYAGDTGPGTTTGQGSNGFGAPWWVVSPDGSPVTGGASTPSTGGGAY